MWNVGPKGDVTLLSVDFLQPDPSGSKSVGVLAPGSKRWPSGSKSGPEVPGTRSLRLRSGVEVEKGTLPSEGVSTQTNK